VEGESSGRAFLDYYDDSCVNRIIYAEATIRLLG